jgi:hypothetical protein
VQPGEFAVERTALIQVPAAAVYSQVSDFRRWSAWSPWERLDPSMQKTFTGVGAGATYAWKGNRDVGEGIMTMTETVPPSLLRIKLEFLKPMEGTSDTTFAFKPEGGGTKVTWTMTGKNDFVGKMFCLFMNMDKMVGGDFERGLASIKALAEGTGK